MLRIRRIIAVAAIALLASPTVALAQGMESYGGEGLGNATSNSPMMHQGITHPGVDDIYSRAQQESAFKIIKDVKLGLKDADPNVRVTELAKLRNLKDPQVNKILIESLTDRDIRVKMKAVDILGAREANDAVTPMSQLLFLRATEPVLKLHLVAALGRIGDSQGGPAVMQYLLEQSDERARGTAVFALGEIGNDAAVPLLTQCSAEDSSALVRRLAKQALEKIDGEVPSDHKMEAAARGDAATLTREETPTDQKLAKLRELDSQLQDQER
jgi:HEAT repeat protein